MTSLFSGYVSALLAEHASNPGQNWKAKDCAMYLVVALAVRGRTAAAGVTSTNQLVNIQDFFNQQVDCPPLPQNAAWILHFCYCWLSAVMRGEGTPLVLHILAICITSQDALHPSSLHILMSSFYIEANYMRIPTRLRPSYGSAQHSMLLRSSETHQGTSPLPCRSCQS